MIAILQGTDAAGNESEQVPFDRVVITPTSISGLRPLLETEDSLTGHTDQDLAQLREDVSSTGGQYTAVQGSAEAQHVGARFGLGFSCLLASAVGGFRRANLLWRHACPIGLAVSLSKSLHSVPPAHPLPQIERNSDRELQYDYKNWIDQTLFCRF